MLFAIDVDVNEALFSLIYIIIDVKNDDNWMWFNILLWKVIDQHVAGYLVDQTLVFIFNHQKDLLESIEHAFLNNLYNYYLYHLWDNLYKYFKNKEFHVILYEITQFIIEE